jgi:hypothetical protein
VDLDQPAPEEGLERGVGLEVGVADEGVVAPRDGAELDLPGQLERRAEDLLDRLDAESGVQGSVGTRWPAQGPRTEDDRSAARSQPVRARP